MNNYKTLINYLSSGESYEFKRELARSELTQNEIETLVILAVDEEEEELVKLLAGKVTDKSCRDKSSRMTIIQISIENEMIYYTEKYSNDYRLISCRMTKLLVDLKFDPLAVNLENLNSLDYAKSRGHYEAYNYILRSDDRLKNIYPPMVRPTKPDRWI